MDRRGKFTAVVRINEVLESAACLPSNLEALITTELNPPDERREVNRTRRTREYQRTVSGSNEDNKSSCNPTVRQ